MASPTNGGIIGKTNVASFGNNTTTSTTPTGSTTLTVQAEDKIYDGNKDVSFNILDNRIPGDVLNKPTVIFEFTEIVLKIDNFLAIQDEFVSTVNPFINSSPILIIAIFILILMILKL